MKLDRSPRDAEKRYGDKRTYMKKKQKEEFWAGRIWGRGNKIKFSQKNPVMTPNYFYANNF